MQARSIGHCRIDKWRAVVEPATGHGRQPLGQSAHGHVVGEGDVGAFEPTPAIEPHLARRVDEHVGDARQAEQRLEWAGAGELSGNIALQRCQ